MTKEDKIALALILSLVGGAILWIAVCLFTELVPKGSIMIEKVPFGPYVRTYTEGFYIVNPFHSFETVDNTYHENLVAEGQNAVNDWDKASGEQVPEDERKSFHEQVVKTPSCSAMGQQTVYPEVKVAYNYTPEKYVELRRSINEKEGGSIDSLVRVNVISAVKDCASMFTANELITKRDEFEETLRKTIEGSSIREGINILEVTVPRIVFTYPYESGIGKKAIAEQTMKENPILVLIAKNEALKVESASIGKSGSANIVEVSTSTGELIKTEAKAKVERDILEAKAKVEREKALGITSQVNQYNAAETWNGTLPQEVMIPDKALTGFFENVKAN